MDVGWLADRRYRQILIVDRGTFFYLESATV